jgi:hypothetical protein
VSHPSGSAVPDFSPPRPAAGSAPAVAPAYGPGVYVPAGYGPPSAPPGYGPLVPPGYGPPVPPGYGPGGYGQPPGYGPAPRPAGVGLPRPVAIEAVPGTPFGVALVEVAPTASGPASASLVAGIGSILVTTVVVCFGLTGARDGWGPVVSGAFAILAAAAGVGAIGLGEFGRRQVRRAGGAVTGRGLALAGLICGGVGLLLTAGAVVLAVGLAAAGGLSG